MQGWQRGTAALDACSAAPSSHSASPLPLSLLRSLPPRSYAASYLYVEQLGGWRSMYGLAAAPAVLLALGGAPTGVGAEHCHLQAHCHPARLARSLLHSPLPPLGLARPCAGMAWLPESPRWLLLSGSGEDAAVDALRRAKGRASSEAAVRDEVDQIQAAMAASPMAQSTGVLGGPTPLPGLQRCTPQVPPAS